MKFHHEVSGSLLKSFVDIIQQTPMSKEALQGLVLWLYPVPPKLLCPVHGLPFWSSPGDNIQLLRNVCPHLLYKSTLDINLSDQSCQHTTYYGSSEINPPVVES